MEPGPIHPDPIPNTARPGRSRLLSPAYEEELARMTGVASTHGAQGRHYATVAAYALFDLEQPGLVPRDEAFSHFLKRNGDLTWSMFSELERIADDHALRAIARLVGRQHLPTGQAVAVIRRIRVGDDSLRAD
jgi:hypothetical protein